MPGQKTILLASANVLDNMDYLKRLQAERRTIIDILHPSRLRQELNIEKEVELTFSELFEQFNQLGFSQRPINLFHYSGHSTEEALLLEDAMAGNKEMSARQVTDFLKLQKGLEVVFLNSCCSESIGEMLLESGIGAVIETTSSVRDEEAARFAAWLYKGLHAGKSLIDAFEQAVNSFEKEICCCVRKETNHRFISGFHIVEEEEKCAWKLAFNEKSFVENWYLVERIHRRFYHQDVTTRVLAIYEKTDYNEQCYKVIRNLFLEHQNVLVYSLDELLAEDNRNELIQETQTAILLFNTGFGGFWSQLEWLYPSLKAMNLLFVGCDGDVEGAYSKVKNNLALTSEVPTFPPGSLTLEKLARAESVEKVVKELFAKRICEKVAQAFSADKAILTDEFDNLNFGKQRQPFESSDEKAFQFGGYNLVLVEGSPFCAQELLIKKLMLYATPRIDRNIKPKILSIGKNIPNALTTSELYQHLTHTLLGVKVNLGVEALRATISQKLEEQDLIIVLNDVFEENGDCLPIFRDLWNELVAGIESPPKHRLFLFIVHKACKESRNHWNASGFVANAPISNVQLLDAIEPLNKTALNTWHGSTGKRFPNGHFFDSLINEPYSSQILKDPFMTKAIHEICALMKCPDVPDRVLTI